MSFQRDIGSQIAVQDAYRLALTSSTGFTTASTASMGTPIDLQSMTGGYHSVKACVALFQRRVSTSDKAYYTVGLRVEMADSSNSTAFDANLTTETQLVVGGTDSGAAGDYYAVHSQDIDLTHAERWIRQVVTITHPATCSFDCIEGQGVLILGGASITPAT